MRDTRLSYMFDTGALKELGFCAEEDHGVPSGLERDKLICLFSV
jgi:hypothetical protein